MGDPAIWRDRDSAFMRYVVIPLAFASMAAIFMAAVVLFYGMTGYRGKGHPRAAPLPLNEAWADVPMLAGLIFVVTFLVLVIKARVWPW